MTGAYVVLVLALSRQSPQALAALGNLSPVFLKSQLVNEASEHMAAGTVPLSLGLVAKLSERRDVGRVVGGRVKALLESVLQPSQRGVA